MDLRADDWREYKNKVAILLSTCEKNENEIWNGPLNPLLKNCHIRVTYYYWCCQYDNVVNDSIVFDYIERWFGLKFIKCQNQNVYM